jgi:hypothetical protein
MRTMMLLSLLISGASHAETLLALNAGPGYVMEAKYDYYKDCKIDTEGNLKYEYGRRSGSGYYVVKKKDEKLSPKRLKQLEDLVEAVRAVPGPYEKYEDGSGDLAGFTFVAFPDDTAKDLEIHAGQDMTVHSGQARKLLRITASLCDMSVPILGFRIGESLDRKFGH